MTPKSPFLHEGVLSLLVLSASVSESRIGRAYSVHGLGGFAGYGAAPVAMLAPPI